MRILLLCLLLWAQFAQAGSSFMDANEAYGKGKFEEAMEGYEKMIALASSAPHADFYFNLGNAAYRAEQPGRAMLAYERALLVQPNHPEALANLKFVRGKAGARVDDRSWMERGLRASLQPATSWVALGLGWAGFALIGFSVLRRTGGLPRWFGIILVAAGLAAGLGLQSSRQELRRVAIVTAKSTDARTEPADRASLAEALPAGSWVRILSEQGGWTYCELPGGGRGWLTTKSVERLLPDGFI